MSRRAVQTHAARARLVARALAATGGLAWLATALGCGGGGYARPPAAQHDPWLACTIVGALPDVATRETLVAWRAAGRLPLGSGYLLYGASVVDCPCGGGTRVAGAGESARLGGASEAARLGGASEGARLGGASESARLGGASEGAQLGGGSEGARLGGASESARLGGASEGARLDGASESSRLGGASESARLAGASESARLGGASEDSRLGGAASGIECRAGGESYRFGARGHPAFLVRDGVVFSIDVMTGALSAPL